MGNHGTGSCCTWYVRNLVFRDAFLATGVSEQQVQVQTQYYTDPKYVLLSLAVTAILAVLGCMISNKLIVKHFRKSGAIK